ncbi:MAG TPA: high-potential iron-sulfur protein [Rhizomicrobium sp.]|nr:high-potential iron-sulfur protein [Rhizomicrobium sp.]
MLRNGPTIVTAEDSNVSRRQMLRNAAVTVGGVTVLLGSVLPAQAKMSLQAAGYQSTPKDDQKCANCSLFQAPSSCILVDGTISAEGWCRFYKKKSA